VRRFYRDGEKEGGREDTSPWKREGCFRRTRRIAAGVRKVGVRAFWLGKKKKRVLCEGNINDVYEIRGRPLDLMRESLHNHADPRSAGRRKEKKEGISG